MPIASPVQLSAISTVVRNANNSTTSLNESLVRTLLGKSSGEIKLGDAIGKPAAGNASYTVPGTYTWNVPAYQNLTVSIAGAGGGGGGGATFVGIWLPGTSGTDGANSSFLTLTATGGEGGQSMPFGQGEADVDMYGTGIGGDTNTSGGGSAGGAGGVGTSATLSQNGAPGGLTTKTWRFSTTSGYPNWGNTITLSVGTRGLGGNGSFGTGKGANGTNGYITISWN
jgi:hypothetical protein